MRTYVLFFVILLIVFSNNAHACSKESVRESKKDAFEAAESVFYAKITESKLIQGLEADGSQEQGDGVQIRYEVIETFKGTPPGDAIGAIVDVCGYGFLSPGISYILYTNYNSVLKDHLISRGTEMVPLVTEDKIAKQLQNLRDKAQKYRSYNK